MCELVAGVQTCALPIYLESRSQCLDRAHAGNHHERAARIVRDVEHRPALPKLDVAPSDAESRIDGGLQIEADGRAIGQLDGFDPVGRGVAPDRHVRSQSRPQHHNKRSEEHTAELQSLMRISYAVFCLKKKKKT